MLQQAQVTTPSTVEPNMKFLECSVKPDLLHTFPCILLFCLIYLFPVYVSRSIPYGQLNTFTTKISQYLTEG